VTAPFPLRRPFLATALLLLAAWSVGAETPPPAGPSTESGPHYAAMFGQRYRTKIDLYVFVFDGDVDHMYLGARGRKGLDQLPEKVTAENVGKTFEHVNILAAVPAGAELTLIAETHETSGTSGVRDHGGIAMGFIARLSYPGNQFDGVLTEYVQTAEQGAPRALNQRIDPAVARLIK
jgi:hypothetical protein